MTVTQIDDSSNRTQSRRSKPAVWECQSEAVLLAGMLEGLDLMNSEGEHYEVARVAITRAALDKCRQLSADLEKLETSISD